MDHYRNERDGGCGGGGYDLSLLWEDLEEGLQEKLFVSALQEAHLHLHALIPLKGHLRLPIIL